MPTFYVDGTWTEDYTSATAYFSSFSSAYNSITYTAIFDNNSATNTHTYKVEGTAFTTITGSIPPLSSRTVTRTVTRGELADGIVYLQKLGPNLGILGESQVTYTTGYSYFVDPPPSRPTSLTATSTRTDGVELVYSGATGAITNYGIFWSTSQTATPTSSLFTDTASPYLDTSIAPGATRYYWIRAQGPGGNSGWFPTTNGVAGFRAFSLPVFTDTTLATSLKLYKAYTDQVTATSATAYSIFTTGAPAGTTGSLPPGLTLNTSTGAITGTPTTQGIYSFRIAAIAGVGGPAAYSPSDTTWHTLTVGPNGTRFDEISSTLTKVPLTTAKRFDETTGWTNLSIMKRFDGTAWQNILNE